MPRPSQNPSPSALVQRQWRREHPDRAKHYNLKRYGGLSFDEYRRMFQEQEDRCYLCGRKETQQRRGVAQALSVDHNHVTGKVRRLLCSNCNRAVGLMRENPIVFEKAAFYLRQFGG